MLGLPCPSLDLSFLTTLHFSLMERKMEGEEVACFLRCSGNVCLYSGHKLEEVPAGDLVWRSENYGDLRHRICTFLTLAQCHHQLVWHQYLAPAKLGYLALNLGHYSSPELPVESWSTVHEVTGTMLTFWRGMLPSLLIDRSTERLRDLSKVTQWIRTTLYTW